MARVLDIALGRLRGPQPGHMTLGRIEVDDDATLLPAGHRLTIAPPPRRERLVLYDIPMSPFCVKVRAMLRYKRLPFETENALRPKHWLTLHKHGVDQMPVLAIDSQLVCDSTDIAYELDRRYPTQPLLPGAPRALALCHAIEEWADESIYFAALHYVWLDKGNAGKVPAVFGRGLVGRIGYAGYRWRIARQLRGQGTGRKTPAQIDVELRRHLGHIHTLLAEAPFVLGDRPLLCDFALYGQLSLLLRADASRAILKSFSRLPAYLERMRALP